MGRRKAKSGPVEPEEEELSLSDGIIAFIETYLRVPEGAHVGKPVVLREWQKDIIRKIYETPTRQAIISLGRKNGKTSFVAMIVLVHMVGPMWRRNSQIFSAAQSRDQAAIVFGLAAKKMVRMSPVLSDPNQIVVRDSAKELFSPRTGVRYKARFQERGYRRLRGGGRSVRSRYSAGDAPCARTCRACSRQRRRRSASCRL
jgi:hypothetical protein